MQGLHSQHSSRKRPPPSGQGSPCLSSQSRRRLVAQPSDSDMFLAVLAEADCTVTGSETVLLGHGDALHLQQRLQLRLKRDNELLAKFLAGLEAHIEDEENIRRLLKPMSNAAKGRECTTVSLVRALLTIAPLQNKVATILLERLPIHLGDEEPGSMSPLMESIPRLILRQFRWLDYLVDSKELTRKLLEVLSICPLSLKKEILNFLPEVIVDTDHEMVMHSLEQLLEENSQLIVPVLDAFLNLNLDERAFEQVATLALSSLRSVDAEDLPLVVKFLLQLTTTLNMKQIVHGLRANLHFVTMPDMRSAKPDSKMKGKSASSTCEALVLETIRTGLRFQTALSEAFLKEIKDIEGERNHKIIDFWLMLLIHANAGPQRRVAESLLLRKVINRDFGKLLLAQSIQGHSKALQDYFQSLISICETLLRNKEVSAKQLGVQAYILLFEEFTDTYYRQEVLGSLITHTGSGIPGEISSALEAVFHLASKYSKELLLVSTFLNGILDYLEGFQISHLFQVYTIFSKLAVASWSYASASGGSSLGDKLIMLIRKQLTNAEVKYKRMGIIGALKLVSCLASVTDSENGPSGGTPPHNSGVGEALSLLQMTSEMCKVSVMASVFFYDELTATLEATSFDVSVIEWVSKHTNEFETTFLADLEAGRIKNQPGDPFLEGELWFNLDGEISPICVNVMPLLVSADESDSNPLLLLPSSFRLLAAVESLTNKGSLGSIDALLGCPLYLPKHELLVGDSWLGMSRSQKEISCFALYHAINWIHELINAFSTQIAEQGECLTQTTREEIGVKLLKRLRNMLCLEHVLNECLKAVPYLKLPQLHFLVDAPDEARTSCHVGYPKQDLFHLKTGKKRSSKLRSRTDVMGGPSKEGILHEEQGEKFKQSTIGDAFGRMNRKAGEGNSQVSGNASSHSGNTQNITGSLNRASSEKGKATQEVNYGVDGYISSDNQNCGVMLEMQKWKLRQLSLSSFSILKLHQASKASCCSDSAAQLPLFLYLLRDLLHKLERCLEPLSRKNIPFISASTTPKEPVLAHMRGLDFFIKLKSLSSSFRAHTDMAVHMLRQFNSSSKSTTCNEHWISHSHAAANPDNLGYNPSNFRTAESVFTSVLRYLHKILTYSELRIEDNLDLLKALALPFCANEVAENEICSDSLQLPSGSLEFIFCSLYAYLDGIFDAATKASFEAATELLLVLKSVVDCAEACVESANNRKKRSRPTSPISYLRTKLSASASKMLQHDWDAEERGNIWKTRGEVLQNLLCMMIRNQESTLEVLKELACNVMPQVPSKGGRCGTSPVEGYPALSAATFIIWYRVQHELVLDVFSKMVKDIVGKSKAKAVLDNEEVVGLFNGAHQCVSIHVALVDLTRKHDQMPVHAIAVKCGGRFVDNFLKGLDFLQSHYTTHKEAVISLVKELQKATRIVQTICAEAKGQKKMSVTCKVPAVKRSMERYVFCIKALLHSASHGTSFWMGNLKHKDLQGQEIGSQLHASDDDEAAVEQSPNAEHGRVSDGHESCDDAEFLQDQSTN